MCGGKYVVKWNEVSLYSSSCCSGALALNCILMSHSSPLAVCKVKKLSMSTNILGLLLLLLSTLLRKRPDCNDWYKQSHPDSTAQPGVIEHNSSRMLQKVIATETLRQRSVHFQIWISSC